MNAVFAITYTPVPNFPAGSVISHIVATIIGTAAGNTTPAVQTAAPDATSIEFANVAADSYTFTVQAEDASGNTFGTPVSGSFTITTPVTVTLNLPSTVAVSQT